MTPEIWQCCCGCDAELGADKFCTSCGEVMPTYDWDPDLIPVYRTVPSRIPALLAKSAAHDIAEFERIEDLAELRAPLSNILNRKAA